MHTGEREARYKALELLRGLNGMPLLEAVMALHLAEDMLRAASRVDITTPDFEYIEHQMETRYADPLVCPRKGPSFHQSARHDDRNGTCVESIECGESV